ncbi:MAG: ribose ABC transporter permease, partial [Oscillospiraceae bacterium]
MVKKKISFSENIFKYSTIFFLVLVCLILTFATDQFLTPSNLVNILSQCSILAIVASGLCFIVAIGGIDLSLTFSYDLGALVSILLMSMGLPWYVAFASGILAGAMLGVLNGFLVTKAKIPIFIATLGTMYIGE